MKKPVLVICYDHFYPAYKAGGPIQSLTNLAICLQNDYDICVLTSAYDLKEQARLDVTETDTWTNVRLPGAAESIRVWYASRKKAGFPGIRDAIKKVNPDFIYLNGMFSYPFVLVPLLITGRASAIICPRGMLQKGALAGKALKKKLYLGLLKMSRLCSNVSWHATNEEEKADISRIFGSRSRITVAGNIPAKPVNEISFPAKEPGKLKLVYLSLITAKKNLLQLIRVLALSGTGVTLDIYGPVKDDAYWEKCREAMKEATSRARYMGDVKPETVQQVFSKYDASVLLTHGENFGHAIYESFSAGRPVITSNFTPWKNLLSSWAGWNVDLSDDKHIAALFNELAAMQPEHFNQFCNGSYAIACDYYRLGFDIGTYRMMFS